MKIVVVALLDHYKFLVNKMNSALLTEVVKDELTTIKKIIGRECSLELATTSKMLHAGYSLKIDITTPKTEGSALKDTICQFNLSQFPGNCAMMITHETFQPPDYRKRGLSVPVQAMKAKIAKYLNYTILLATTVPGNYNDKVLARAGFKRLDPLCFVSTRTSNRITTWMKVL